MAYLEEHFKVDFDEVKSRRESIFQGKFYRITVLSERLVRFEYNSEGRFLDAPTNFAINRKFNKVAMKVEQNAQKILITTRYFSLQYLKERPFKGPFFAPDTNLRVKLNNTDKTWYPSHPEARNYKSSAFSLEDIKKVNLEKGLYSTDGFVTVDDSSALIIEADGGLRKSPDSNNDFYLFMYRRDFGFCLKDYFQLTGYPALLPKYALGVWWNRDLIYNENNLDQLIDLFDKYEIPLSVLLLSEYWHLDDLSKYEKTGYDFSKALFPNLKNTVKKLNDNEIYLGINLDPTPGIRVKDEVFKKFQKDLGLEGEKPIPFNIYNKRFAGAFLKNILNKLINQGVSFFWLDYNSDIKQLEALKYYTFNNYKKFEDRRPLLLAKNSFVSSHRYPIIYTGETKVSWKTLDYLPFFNSTNSNIGLSWLSHDVGGYKNGTEDSELYLRYVQFSTFNPIFRFSSKRGKYYKREPWLWDIKTYVIVKNYINLRYRLIPYIYSENYHYHKNGLPISLPLYYNNPEIYDEPLYKNHYHFGSELLVAPITKPKDPLTNRSIERIFLPKGNWYDFKSGKKFKGNKRYILFYKDDEYPVFVREGGIIPLSIQEENKNSLSNPKTLEVNVFPGKNNVYNLYEDDGRSNLHESGYYIVTSFDYNYMLNNYTLIIHPTEGKSGIIPKHRDYIIKFRNTKKADEVLLYVNGVKANNKVETYSNEQDFVVHIYKVDTTKQLTINCKGNNIEIDTTRIFNDDINSILDEIKIKTNLKEQIAEILFSDKDIKRKRILLKKLGKKQKINKKYISMFLKLLEYSSEI